MEFTGANVQCSITERGEELEGDGGFGYSGSMFERENLLGKQASLGDSEKKLYSDNALTS